MARDAYAALGKNDVGREIDDGVLVHAEDLPVRHVRRSGAVAGFTLYSILNRQLIGVRSGREVVSRNVALQTRS